MAKSLNTLETHTDNTVGGLENTASRLARELDIELVETPLSGSTYEKEIAGKNNGIAFAYFREFDGYEVIEAERKSNRLCISNVKGKYSIIVKNTGSNLLSARNPYSAQAETRLFAAIMEKLVTLQKQPEDQHEICVSIDKEDLDTISEKTVKKYI